MPGIRWLVQILAGLVPDPVADYLHRTMVQSISGRVDRWDEAMSGCTLILW